MSQSTITFFPVGDKNGGMTLIRLNNHHKTTILIDCSIPSDKIADSCDVKQELYNRLPKDDFGRSYVDAFILTHRHDDHLLGFKDNFHLGKISDYDNKSKKILIKELWSSHNFWKPESQSYSLCDDAKAFNREMKRRVDLFEETKEIQGDYDRAIVVGTDPEGRTEGKEAISIGIGEAFATINNLNVSSCFSGIILGPIGKQKDESDKDFIDKNRQSIVMQITLRNDENITQILYGADAEYRVWSALEKEFGALGCLDYDILYIPHHCSWHSISADSQSECDDPQPDAGALAALSHSNYGACMVSQSKAIKDDDNDPPSFAAKQIYLGIVQKEYFYCTNEYPSESSPGPLEFNITDRGYQLAHTSPKSHISTANSKTSQTVFRHG